MIIAGIDPGLTATGYGFIDLTGNKITPLDWGVIRSKGDNLSERLLYLHNHLTEVLQNHNPAMIGVEEIFTGKNPRSALMLGHARGVILLTAKQTGSPVFEYSARLIKQAVVGRGAARKEQVKYMVQRLLSLESKKIASDASDALAVALCCSLRQNPLYSKQVGI